LGAIFSGCPESRLNIRNYNRRDVFLPETIAGYITGKFMDVGGIELGVGKVLKRGLLIELSARLRMTG
jgi:hypothetical protein